MANYLKLLSFVALAGSATPAMAATPIDSCAKALQFDTTVLNQNYAAQLSVINLVTESTYEEAKASLGASLVDLFSGNFDSFSGKRAELQRQFSSSQAISESTDLYQRALSPAGAKAYAECVAQVQRLPLTAYVSTGQRSEFVGVTIRNNQAGNSSIQLTLITPDYVQRMNEPTVLSAGGEQQILFRSPLSQPFVLLINGQDLVSGASLTPSAIELPPYVEYRMVESSRTYTVTQACGAGGHGSTTGSPLKEVATFSADPDYRLKPETVALTDRQLVFGPGIVRDPDFRWIASPPGNNRPSVLRGDFDNCEGASGDTQSRVNYTFRIEAVRQTITKVTS